MISKLAAAHHKASPKNSPKGKKEQLIHVLKIKRIPYGLFEKQLWEYFTQFGKVVRVRVARSVKTGNHKGWAYIGFADKEVAEIAAQSMNGYLMFEKRLSCHVMDPEKVPKSMKNGPRYLAPPHMKGRAKKEALKRNKKKTPEQESKSKRRRETAHKKLSEKLKLLGIEYEFGSTPNTSTSVKATVKSAEKPEDNEFDQSDAESLQAKVRKPVKTLKVNAIKVLNKVSASKVKNMRKSNGILRFEP